MNIQTPSREEGVKIKVEFSPPAEPPEMSHRVVGPNSPRFETMNRSNVEADTGDMVTESLSTEDSVDLGARELIAMKFAEIPDDTDEYVTGADPQRLVNKGTNDDVEFEVHDEGEERVGVEGRDWMWNPLKKLPSGGFDFVVRVGRRKQTITPGTMESFGMILAGTSNLGAVKLLEIHGGVRVVSIPERAEDRSILVGEKRWNM